jgi:hypothetical protein
VIIRRSTGSLATGLVLAMLGAGTPGAAAAQDLPAVDPPVSAAPDTFRFVLADWRAEALGRQVAGMAGWVAEPGGALRLDLTVRDDRAGDPPPGTGEAVLARHGRGWTLVTGAGGDGVYGAWDREWQAPPAGLSELAHEVAALSASPGDGPARRTLTLASDPTATAAPDRPGRGFRRALATRGRGGGGPGERVTVSGAPGDGGVRVRSSRRPGWLEVVPRERRTALGVAEELFLPWYPLGEVLTFLSAAETGTSVPGRR